MEKTTQITAFSPNQNCIPNVSRDEETFRYIVSQRVDGENTDRGISLNGRQVAALRQVKILKKGGECFLKTNANLSRSDIIAIATSLANRLGKVIRYENESFSFMARPGDRAGELEAKLMRN